MKLEQLLTSKIEWVRELCKALPANQFTNAEYSAEDKYLTFSCKDDLFLLQRYFNYKSVRITGGWRIVHWKKYWKPSVQVMKQKEQVFWGELLPIEEVANWIKTILKNEN